MSFVGEYRIIETFYSLQGEGAHTGRAAYFIRLAGCEARCAWCDTEQHARGAVAGVPRSEAHACARELAAMAKESGACAVVVTGGEPLLHDLGPLTEALHEAGMEVWLETSGAGTWSGSFDWVCLSPKQHHPPVEENYGHADELKVVIHSRKDLEWAEACAGKFFDAGHLWYIRPVLKPSASG